ncbi:MAG: hypothetical protein V4479_07610 [Actinomycetota bacterium]
MPDTDDTQSFDASSPAIYLVMPSTPEEHSLAGSVGLHDGEPVPFHMLAKVAGRLHKVSTWASRFDVFMRRGKRWAYAGISAALLNLGIAGHFVIDRAEAVGAADERAAAIQRESERFRNSTDEKINELRLDIRELRAALRRISGTDLVPQGTRFNPPDSSAPRRRSLDKLSLHLTPPQGLPQCLLLDTALPWLRSL